MAIFHLNIRDEGIFIPDVEGQEFISLPAARNEAMHSLREIIAERIRFGRYYGDFRIDITNAIGEHLAIVDLEDAKSGNPRTVAMTAI